MEIKAKLQADFESKAQKIHAISQLLKAYSLYMLDVDYVVQEGKVSSSISTPAASCPPSLERRPAPGRRGQGRRRNRTRDPDPRYDHHPKLFPPLHQAGRHDGTAETEAAEFFDIYKLGVLTIPTNQPNIRKDADDSVYKTAAKNSTPSSRKSSSFTPGRPCSSAPSPSRPAKCSPACSRRRASSIPSSTPSITSRRPKSSPAPASAAPSPSPPTWRPRTDIKLGEGVAQIGGLHVLGTERHESRRIDRQLRGRCSRQGDPGSSHFFISLEDDLMRLFGSDRIVKLMSAWASKRARAEARPPQPLHPAGPEKSRAAQLPDPQAHARVRRRDEQAARSRLWLPQRNHPQRRRSRPPHGHHRGSRHPQGRGIFGSDADVGECAFARWPIG